MNVSCSCGSGKLILKQIASAKYSLDKKEMMNDISLGYIVDVTRQVMFTLSPTPSDRQLHVQVSIFPKLVVTWSFSYSSSWTVTRIIIWLLDFPNLALPF